MVTIKPISMANQSKSATKLGAIAIKTMVTAIFNASQTKKPKPAVMAFKLEN